jgi:hypothetical protein
MHIKSIVVTMSVKHYDLGALQVLAGGGCCVIEASLACCLTSFQC